MKEKFDLKKYENRGPISKAGVNIILTFINVVKGFKDFILAIVTFLWKCYNGLAEWRKNTKLPGNLVLTGELIIFFVLAGIPITYYYGKMVEYRDRLDVEIYEIQKKNEQDSIQRESAAFSRGWKSALDSIKKKNT